MEKSLLVIFDKIWLRPCDFGRILEQLLKFIKNPILIGISSNLKNNIRTCICIRKNYENGEISPSHFWQNLAETLYYSTGTLAKFGATLKIHKKSNFDWN